MKKTVKCYMSHNQGSLWTDDISNLVLQSWKVTQSKMDSSWIDM